MKRKNRSIALKKQTALLLHIVFLCLFLTGLTLVLFNKNFRRGLGWIQEESYVDTLPFTQQLESDVETIFKYIQYKDLLEEDGEINYDASMFCVTYNSGYTKIYTLNEAISYARRLGYYLTDAYEVAGGPAVHEKDMPGNSSLLIEWKAYDPDEIYTEPGDAFSTVEDLSVQVLNVLAEYYHIRYNYIDQPSNLYFRVSYLDDAADGSGEAARKIYTNAPDLSNEDLRNMGRYLFISGDSIFVDSNLRHVPTNITSQLVTHNRSGNDDYYILLGIDTGFPNADPYAAANSEYDGIRAEYIGGVLLLVLGLAGLAATFVIMARLTGHTDGSPSIALYYPDRLPAECTLLLLAAALRIGDLVCQNALYRFVRLFVSREYTSYAEQVVRGVVLYAIAAVVFFSLLRSFKARRLWKDSLLYRLFGHLMRAVSGYPLPLKSAFGFAAYLLCSAGLTAACLILYSRRVSMRIPYLYLLPALILAVFQVWVFFLIYRSRVESAKISGGIMKMSGGDTSYKIDSTGFSEDAARVSNALNTLGDGLNTALQERVKSERLKADLITNVSHDIKTPLTSIINYVDLLKREQIQDEKIQGYLNVLDQKSQRLKTLTEDLVEASKASSGNIKLEISDIDLVELIHQSNGEFEERFARRNLELVSSLPAESILIAADGRRMWRVIENLYNNAFKYAMENSRVYVDVETEDGLVCFTMKNVSASPLNIHADELTERFVRGDVARTTEGSGLGLSIAKSLTELQGGKFQIYIDGDLFKVQVTFPVLQK